MESNLNEKLLNYKLKRVHGRKPEHSRPFCFELILKVIEREKKIICTRSGYVKRSRLILIIRNFLNKYLDAAITLLVSVSHVVLVVIEV